MPPIAAATFLPKVAEIHQRAAEIHREQRRALREAEEREAIEAYAATAGPSPTGPAHIQEFVGQVRSAVPVGDHEAFASRRVAWKRDRRHHQRQANAEATLPTTIDETHTGVVCRNSSSLSPSRLLGTHSHTSTTWMLALTPASPRLTARLLIMPAEPRAAGPRRPRHE